MARRVGRRVFRAARPVRGLAPARISCGRLGRAVHSQSRGPRQGLAAFDSCQQRPVSVRRLAKRHLSHALQRGRKNLLFHASAGRRSHRAPFSVARGNGRPAHGQGQPHTRRAQAHLRGSSRREREAGGARSRGRRLRGRKIADRLRLAPALAWRCGVGARADAPRARARWAWLYADARAEAAPCHAVRDCDTRHRGGSGEEQVGGYDRGACQGGRRDRFVRVHADGRGEALPAAAARRAHRAGAVARRKGGEGDCHSGELRVGSRGRLQSCGIEAFAHSDAASPHAAALRRRDGVPRCRFLARGASSAREARAAVRPQRDGFAGRRDH